MRDARLTVAAVVFMVSVGFTAGTFACGPLGTILAGLIGAVSSAYIVYRSRRP